MQALLSKRVKSLDRGKLRAVRHTKRGREREGEREGEKHKKTRKRKKGRNLV